MLKAIVTSGATIERIDPVRYITNDSSGKQGHAIAQALQENGVNVTLISGKVNIPPPENVNVISVESAEEMLTSVENSLPADIFVSAAAVCDWKPEQKHSQKMKKTSDKNYLDIRFVKTPDILKTISNHKMRPKIVVGFAAETENLLENAKTKLINKGCDYILANDVSKGVFGSETNTVSLVSKCNIETWDKMSKKDVADKLSKIILSSINL
ncbi:MAG: phosphopantothenoylcysteine decarboxylase [Rickettsiales bacterium]|nr:phosphopantothenoylcysteine decarboxylase [Rickettsiales bacterium]MDG4546117.1 phosphopantothenoylcysteine decarboxylase [Rickettsiales bacterium]MDG4547590.1 phosphopantothenoylcysteine decarboxylase [Rickettsiales bacterium]